MLTNPWVLKKEVLIKYFLEYATRRHFDFFLDLLTESVLKHAWTGLKILQKIL